MAAIIGKKCTLQPSSDLIPIEFIFNDLTSFVEHSVTTHFQGYPLFFQRLLSGGVVANIANADGTEDKSDA